MSVSLPRLADLIGYERRDEEALRAVQRGYPRFHLHPLVRRLQQHIAAQYGRRGDQLPLLTRSRRGAAVLCAYAGIDWAAVASWRDIFVVWLPDAATVFVTGATGFLGSHFVYRLLLAGTDVALIYLDPILGECPPGSRAWSAHKGRLRALWQLAGELKGALTAEPRRARKSFLAVLRQDGQLGCARPPAQPLSSALFGLRRWAPSIAGCQGPT